ncbi:hypothetical protein D3C73_1205130 [compost metagenome]
MVRRIKHIGFIAFGISIRSILTTKRRPNQLNPIKNILGINGNYVCWFWRRLNLCFLFGRICFCLFIILSRRIRLYFCSSRFGFFKEVVKFIRTERLSVII